MGFENCSDVRLAVPEDHQAIYDLLMEAHAEQGQHPISPDKIHARIYNGVTRNGAMIGVVGDKGGPIKAAIMLVLDEVWYSNDLQLLEFLNFVSPVHRRSSYAKQLIEFAKKSARELTLDLSIGVYSDIKTQAKVRLYQRQLGQPIGAFFLYRPKGCQDEAEERDNIGRASAQVAAL